MEHFRVIHRSMHKGITKLRTGHCVIIYFRHASKTMKQKHSRNMTLNITRSKHTCQLDLNNENYKILMDYMYILFQVHVHTCILCKL